MTEPVKPGEPAKPGVAAPAPVPGSQTPPVPPEPAKTPAPQPPAGQPAQTPPAGPGATPPAGEPKADTVPIAALLDERGKRQALETELSQLKQRAPSPNQQTMYPQQQPLPQANPQNEQLDKLWQSDPRSAVNAQIMLSIDGYDRINNFIDVQADDLMTKYTDFNTHRTAATQYVRSMPIQQRGQPGVLEAAYFYVKGQNVDDIIKANEAEIQRKILAGEYVATPPAGTQAAPAPQPGAVQITPEQRAVAQAMGMSEEDYVANIKTKPQEAQ